MADQIRDNTELGQYELEVNGKIAFVTYRRSKSATVLVHTEVPESLREHGVGSRLIKGVLEMMRAEGRKIAVICHFIAGYIRKHPEYQDLLAAPLRDPEREKLDSRLDEALDESFPASDPPAVTPEH